MNNKWILVLGILLLGSVMVACIPPTNTTTTTTTTVESVDTTISSDSDLEVQLLAIYQLATSSGVFTGTYEEWLESVRGPQGVPGEDGRQILLQVTQGELQWQYEGDDVWTSLFDLTSLEGASGKEVILQVNDNSILWQYSGDETWNVLLDLAALTENIDVEVYFQVVDGYIQWKTSNDETWTNLIELITMTGDAGEDGKEVFLQVLDGSIQWQHEGDESWQVLIDIASLTGQDGQEVTFRVYEGFIQWQYVGSSDWVNLIDMSTLTGPAGLDGKEVLLQVIDGTIQWQHEGEDVWHNLIDIASLTGQDGQEVTFRIFEGYIQWQYVGTSEWMDLIDLASLTGASGEDGLSAYEIYMKYYPNYTGDEEQWINDLINGRLGTADEAYLLSYFDLGDVNFNALASGGQHALAISVDGELYAWGSNEFGQIGDGTTINRLVPVNITDNLGLGEYESVMSITCGFYNSYVLTSEKRLLAWGYNHNGQIGNGTAIDEHLAVDITSYFSLHAHETIEEIIPGFYHNYVLTSEHRVFAWGMDSMDQLGNSDLSDQLSPIDLTSVFGLSEGDYIVSISAGGWHNLALSKDGVVYAWGNNEYGQVGTGDMVSVPTPTNITSRFGLYENETVVSLIAGSRHSFAITSEGRVFGWGDNSRSQLGMAILGFTVVDPTDVSACFDLHESEVVTAITAMGDYSLGLTSEGRIFSWGNNYYGQLGDGTTRNRSTPGDITYTFNLGVDEHLIAIAEGHFHSLALSSSGRLYAWGNNDFGQLGDGTLLAQSLPDDLTIWVSIWRENLYYGSALGYPVTPVRSGFVFMGWYYEPTFETQSINALMTAGNVDLYARWELLDVYLVEFDTGEGSHVFSRQITENDYLFLPEDEPTRVGYTFVGWYMDVDCTIPANFPILVTSDMTLYALWSINSYTMTFETNEGSIISSLTQEYASELLAPVDPEKEGYTFAGWFEDESLTIPYIFTTMPAYDLTIYAKWDVNQYSILFDSNGGSLIDPLIQDFGSEIILPDNPTREGYTFDGWYEDTDLTIPFTLTSMPSHDISLKAKWTINTYTISFESNGGSAVLPITQDFGSEVSAPENPTKDGFTFNGWFEDTGLTIPYVFTTMPSQDIVLYAAWEAVTP